MSKYFDKEFATLWAGRLVGARSAVTHVQSLNVITPAHPAYRKALAHNGLPDGQNIHLWSLECLFDNTVIPLKERWEPVRRHLYIPDVAYARPELVDAIILRGNEEILKETRNRLKDMRIPHDPTEVTCSTRIRGLLDHMCGVAPVSLEDKGALVHWGRVSILKEQETPEFQNEVDKCLLAL